MFKLFKRNQNFKTQEQIPDVETEQDVVFAPSESQSIKKQLLKKISTVSDEMQLIPLDNTVWQIKAHFIFNGRSVDSLSSLLTEEVELEYDSKLLKILPTLKVQLTATDVFTNEIIDLGTHEKIVGLFSPKTNNVSIKINFEYFDEIKENIQKKVPNSFLQINEHNKVFNAKCVNGSIQCLPGHSWYGPIWFANFHLNFNNQYCDVYAVETLTLFRYIFIGRFEILKQSTISNTQTVVQLGNMMEVT